MSEKERRVRGWTLLILRYARRERLHPSLVAGVMEVESGGDPHTPSAAGAVGLMQVMPGEIIPGRPTAEELRDPIVNIAVGCLLLSDAWKRWGTTAGTLASYYGAVDEQGHPTDAHDGSGVTGWEYVRRVEMAAEHYRDLDEGAGNSEVLLQFDAIWGNLREIEERTKHIRNHLILSKRALGLE